MESNLKHEMESKQNNITYEKTVNESELLIEKKIKILREFVTPFRWDRIHQVIESRTFQVAPVLEHIYDNGNISAVMRSAESFGFANFHIIERPDGQFKHSQRVSQGTEKWLKIRKSKNTSECLGQLKSQGFKIYATHLEATVKIEDINFAEPTAIIFGNEKDGVSKEALEICDGKFIIPMYGFAQSFNISVAAALCFYHIHNFRGVKLGKSGDLGELDKKSMTLDYLIKSIDGADKILSHMLR